tara:strand:- start:11345 stop:11851 length:507 start_codon:yes stop_codon:yes gene_type:complete
MKLLEVFLENKEEIIKFAIGLCFLIAIHYQMIANKKNEINKIEDNIIKIKESILALNNNEKNNYLNFNQVKNETFVLEDKKLSSVYDLNLITENFMDYMSLDIRSYIDFMYFIRSKKLGVIDISFKSKFYKSKNFLEYIQKYSKLINLQYVKIVKNYTKISFQIIYDK